MGHYHRWQKGKGIDTPLAARSPQVRVLHEAYHAGDWDGMLAALEALSVKTATGCWVWQRGLNQYGYGQFSVRKGSRRSTVAAHRLTGMALSRRRLLTSEVVHHTCARKDCVGPEHLQVVTNEENIAEMLERNGYLGRITALEEALRSLAPEHLLLDL
jgi:hypothetical protein